MNWLFYARRRIVKPFINTTTSNTRTTTTGGNAYVDGIRTTVSNSNTITTTLRARFGYSAVSKVTTTTTTVTQAPPLVNNAAPVAPGAPANLYQLEGPFAQPPVPRVSTTTSTQVTTTVSKVAKPRWRLVPVRRGKSVSWVWRVT